MYQRGNSLLVRVRDMDEHAEAKISCTFIVNHSAGMRWDGWRYATDGTARPISFVIESDDPLMVSVEPNVYELDLNQAQGKAWYKDDDQKL